MHAMSFGTWFSTYYETFKLTKNLYNLRCFYKICIFNKTLKTQRSRFKKRETFMRNDQLPAQLEHCSSALMHATSFGTWFSTYFETFKLTKNLYNLWCFYKICIFNKTLKTRRSRSFSKPWKYDKALWNKKP